MTTESNQSPPASLRYLAIAGEILQRIAATQGDTIEAAAQLCANTIASDGLVFCWGGGHSRMSVEEMFPRIGSYPGFYPMVELALTFYTNFIGADGMAQSFFLERQERYVDAILANYEFGPHDSMICFSSTGINGLVIEMALQAKARGLPVVAVTSIAHAESTVSRHSSGRKLRDVADVTIDNCTPPGDAVVGIEGLKYKVSPTSTIGATAVVNALKARTAELLVERGAPPVVLTSPHFADRPEEAEEQLQRVYKEFKRRKRMIYGRTSLVTPLLLGIDVGTSFVKAVLATPDGRVVAQAQAGYATNHPRPGWAEQDPHDWWRGVVVVTRAVLAAAGSGPSGEAQRAIAAIGVSGQGCAVTPIGAKGEALHPAIIWMDNRSEPQCERLRQECASQILHINGKSPAPYNADPVLMWLQEHAPQLIEGARYSLTTTGYVNFRLTGKAVTNSSDASILFAYDLAHGNWSSALLAAFGLPARLYPEVQPCRTVIGGLTPAAGFDLGLPAGIPVIAGGEDTSSAGLALGAVRPGMAFLSLGTAGTLYATELRPLVHPQLLAFAHVLEHQFLVGGSMGAIGAALAWLRTALGDNEDHAALLELAGTANPGAGSLIFLPYLNGELQPINDGYARGVFFGLGMHTGKAELVRAVLEGAAYAIAQNLEYAELLSGPVHEVRATGGPTRSTLWCQIIADVCNRPLSVLAAEGGAPLGNALLAGSGVGLVGDLVATAEKAAEVRKNYAPDTGRHEHYRRLFSVYKQLYPNLKDLYVELARA